MAQLRANSNIEQVTDQIRGDMRRHIPFATALALTRTGQHVKDGQREAMKRVFDNPTRWTLNSVFLRPARKRDQDPKAIVWLKDEAPKGTPATDYLRPQIDGGVRGNKRSEKLLYARGLLPKGMYAVPGSGMRLDRHGNVSRGQLQRILSNLRAQFDTWQNSPNGRHGLRASANPSGGDYFVGRPGGNGALGIWKRSGTDGQRLQPMFLFTSDRPDYRGKYDFNAVAQDIADRVMVDEMRKALDEALTG